MKQAVGQRALQNARARKQLGKDAGQIFTQAAAPDDQKPLPRHRKAKLPRKPIKTKNARSVLANAAQWLVPDTPH